VIYSKELFDLQLSFAERAQAFSGMPLEHVLFEYTNFYVRFGLGRELDPEHDGWQAYLEGVRGARDVREWTYRYYLKDAEVRTAPAVVATRGCFSYAAHDEKRIRLHFRVPDDEEGSPLAAARFDARHAELAALFEHLKRNADEHITVIGASWLYNLNAYRRLFPADYVASARRVRGRFQSMPLWGQFVDHRGQVKQSMANPFLSAVAACTSLADLDACFPLQVLAVQASARCFFEHYRL
jgi:hypothetical protein